MKKNHLSSTRSSVAGNSGKEGTSTQLKGEVLPGSLIWVRLNGDSWWPAQVVDGDSVSESNKPSNRLAGEVLVRLYGSYKYLYADPLKCQYEFESVLKQDNGSYHHVFVKALERELPSSTSATSKKRGHKHTERRSNGASKDKKSNHVTEDRTHNLEDRKSGDADTEGYIDLSAKRPGGHRVDTIAERSKTKLGSQRAEGANLKAPHCGKTHRKERLSSNQDPSNSETFQKDGLPTTPRTVEAGDIGISGRERIVKCLEQKNGSIENPKIRGPNQDGVKKNHESSTDNASVSARRKNLKLEQNSVSSRIKLYGRSAAKQAKLRIAGQLDPKVKPKAVVKSIQSKVETKSLKHHEVKNEQKQKSICQHEQQGCGEVDQHDSMPRGLKRKGRIMDHDKECKTLKQEEYQKNCKPSSVRVDEDSTNKSPLLDRSVKKLNANKRKTEQDNVQKDLKPNIKYAKEETKMQAAKQVELVKKQKPASAIKKKSQAPSPSSTERAQVVCTRRLRVMRSLGLISPAGSPYQKGEHHCLSC
ncbi:uncharacterized protein LOC115739525 [Rhodamnia argentea]|uniref:Uncharacterized protein LOC115739525 n=1 Tax=Rhodamnia argentea TaxID=178133 RepID=A0ABM3H2G6_9MYRT|nr:uncharacterized protein LOC115739525 [Rhodamnia argentea]